MSNSVDMFPGRSTKVILYLREYLEMESTGFSAKIYIWCYYSILVREKGERFSFGNYRKKLQNKSKETLITY